MTKNSAAADRLVSDDLHPRIYLAIVGLALWLVLSVWVFFGSGYYTGLSNAVVTGFIVIAIAVPYIIWRVGRRNSLEGSAKRDAVPFRHWMAGEVDTWTGRVNARNAGIEVLLPIAAVAFGMTAFGIALHLAASGEL